MASPNMNLRDPAIYRIVRAHHHRQGDKWCIYPLYDFAHPIQDALEGITHSMCSIEFENHRPLYEWVVDNCPLPHHPKQREFARLNVTHTVMSKRYLRQLVFEKHVEGWDDPRMPTLCALRRRGYTPSAILDFVQRAGIAKANSLVDIKLLEHCIREELNDTALRSRSSWSSPTIRRISARSSRYRTIRAMRKPAPARYRSPASCISKRATSLRFRPRSSSVSSRTARSV